MISWLLLVLAATPGLDPTEVTVSAWSRCVAAGACPTTSLNRSDWGPASLCNLGVPGRDAHPMNCVSQAEAAKYCQWAGAHLPSDGEWDAAVGTGRFPWGDAPPDQSRLCRRAMDEVGTCPVGAFPPGATATGRLDLAGNVAEWTSTRSCPTCTSFIHRGGGFGGSWGPVLDERLGHLRANDEGALRGSYLGFRCAAGAGPAPGKSGTLPQAPTVKVDVHVLTRADQTGNEQWSQEFLTRVLDRAQSLTHGDVRFELASRQVVADAALYDTSTQPPLLDWASQHATVGHLTVVISNPHTSDTAGFGRVNSAAKDFKPHLVMRSRKNSATEADLYECASIFLHELGHTVGFTHDGTPAAMPWPCDDWWNLTPARERVKTLARWMDLHERGPGARAREAFTCKVGAPVPDTGQLFDPPTNAPTPAECAQRCLDWPGCVATAQPTWANARCFLFGADAQVIKKKGWNNVDVCWKN